MHGKKLNIVLISPESWGDNYVSKHHYARYLSKKYNVFFLNPIQSSRWFKIEITSRKEADNLSVCEYTNPIPKLNSFPKFIRRIIWKKQLKKIKTHLQLEQVDFVWSFDPYRFCNLTDWQAKHHIYHSVDIHKGYKFEKVVSSTSDINLVSSELISPNLCQSAAQIHDIGHAADIDNFIKGGTIELPGNNKIKAGLIGNFNANVDYQTIQESVNLNPDIDFIFVGPYKSNNLGDTNSELIVSELIENPNVFFIGSVHSDKIISYLNSFDINMILYREDKRDIIINPHKVMGYFYAGNITVSSWFNQYKNSDKELIYMTQKNSEIANVINEVKSNLSYWNSNELKQGRKKFAEQNSYDKKINFILSQLK